MKFIRYICDKDGNPRINALGNYDAIYLNEQTGNLQIRQVSL